MTNKKSLLYMAAAVLLLLLALTPALPVLGQTGGREPGESSGVERYLDGVQNGSDGEPAPPCAGALAELEQVLDPYAMTETTEDMKQAM